MKKKNHSALGGEVYGNFVVIKELPRKITAGGNVFRMVRCKCICGKEVDILFKSVTSGASKTCGCLTKQTNSIVKQRTTHGLHKHPLYWRWCSMLQRCYDTNHKAYHNYGGRGIKVCEKWRSNFKIYYDWCMKNGYSPDLELDRRNNDKGYMPSNCRFVTRIQNCNNTRQCVFVRYKNKKLTVSQVSRIELININSLRKCLKMGLSINEAIKKIKSRECGKIK